MTVAQPDAEKPAAYSELTLIHQLQQLPVHPPVLIGIGDDGAVIDSRSHGQQVVVTDMLVDGVHFDRDTASPEDVGYKSIAVNLSDLAAMGAVPTAAFISQAIPKAARDPKLMMDAYYRSAAALAAKYGFTIAGGDTTSTDGPWVVNVCMIGVPICDRILTRCGARVGDRLAVTGPLGGSLKSGRHLKFLPRVEESQWLVRQSAVHAMMDLSDGLSTDLSRMMMASQTGAVLDGDAIPIHCDVPNDHDLETRRHHALSDGEDFELLISVDSDQWDQLSSACPYPLIPVGTVVKEQALSLRTAGGDLRPVAVDGFVHSFHE